MKPHTTTYKQKILGYQLSIFYQKSIKKYPGRPIVNGIGSVTEKISAYVDTFPKKYSPRIPSYIRDTTHFLNTLKHLEIQNTDLLVTIDVKSLYTNIPHTEGIAAITRLIEETGLDTLHKMFIYNLAHQVLTKNYFIFNGQMYRQKQGTAMGTRMAPNYAIIFMHYIQSNLLKKSTLKPKTCLRFTDDIFMIWPHGIQTLTLFMDMINSHNPTIKFTYEYHTQEIPFWTQYYTRQKTTNCSLEHTTNQQTINSIYTSIQPILENKKNQSFGLLIRSRRICSEEKYFEEEARNIIQQLKHRKYPQIF